jgi:hypothetical protein
MANIRAQNALSPAQNTDTHRKPGGVGKYRARERITRIAKNTTRRPIVLATLTHLRGPSEDPPGLIDEP